MKSLLKNIALLGGLFLGVAGLGKNYIVMFPIAEEGLGGLGHEALEQRLQLENEASVEKLQAFIQGKGRRSTNIKNLWLIQGAVVSLSDLEANLLKLEPWVASVMEDRQQQFLNPVGDLKIEDVAPSALGESYDGLWGLKQIGLYNIRRSFPQLTGEGVRVGILDTGIQSNHPQLWSNQGVQFRDFINHLKNPYDDHGHGTHVAGTIKGHYTGIAPKVSLVVGKMLSAGGWGEWSTIVESMQWMADPDGDPTTDDYPRLVSNSWGGTLWGKEYYDILEFEPLFRAVKMWVRAGILPVFAAGNSGWMPNGVPGGFPDSLAVGAIMQDATPAWFSSYGPNNWLIGGKAITVFKPDISAPGYQVTSSFPGNAYATWSGTSMATPHVSGILALAFQANPKLTYAEIKQLLTESACGGPDFQLGQGYLNGYVFIQSVVSGRKSVS